MFARFFPNQRLTAPATKREEPPPPPRRTTYTDLVRDLKSGKVDGIMLGTDTDSALYTDQDGSVNQTIVSKNEEFWRVLLDSGADVELIQAPPQANNGTFFSAVFMWLLVFLVGRAIIDRARAGGGADPFGMMKTDHEVEGELDTRFADVEGIDAAREELEEIVDFLKNTEKYEATGAKIPRGCLLTGSPGCGKTLLARAIAGESNVPFISCSGSSFVELFVGMGAKRVRDLFEKARQIQPCIIFIDEIDAVGKARSAAGGMASNDEREQTVNQLLTEMDGFDNDTQIIVLAATNRADLLDDALVRPGRFDRKISVALPGVDGRERILQVHAKDKPLGADVDLRGVARQTTGFSGADLANLMNECAIRAARDDVGVITPEIVESVYQRIVVGARSDTIFSPAKKELVAYHEAGHAVVGAFHPEYDLLRKISIIPRGDTGGVTYFTPDEDIDIRPRSYYMAQLRVMLGGRAAEEVVYGETSVTTGASSDYAHVYSLARQMLTVWGFGKHNFDYNNMSPDAARRVDEEIDALVKTCYEETRDLIIMRRAELEMIKFKLIEEEIVDGSWVYETVMCGDQVNGCRFNEEDL